MDAANLALLKQDAMRELLHRAGTGPWTTVYKNWYDDAHNGGWFAAFTPIDQRDTVLARDGWDLHKGQNGPGFAEWHQAGQVRREYLRYGNSSGIEPIVITQDHWGTKPDMLPQVVEEFRLYHNLWSSSDSSQLVKVEEDGNVYVAAEITRDRVRIRTKLLRQFVAIQMRLGIGRIKALAAP